VTAHETLPALLADVTTAAGYRYGAHDDAGRSLDCLKVQGSWPSRYLGASHLDEGGTFNVYLSSSTDLLDWSSVRQLDTDASQPTLEPDGKGGWLFGVEVTRSRGGNCLRFRHYVSTDALVHGKHDRQFEPPSTLASRGSAQGTPDFSDVEPSPDVDRSVIRVGFHYFAGRDLQATGTLTDLSRWSAHALPDLDARFVGAKGNVGDRDCFTFEGRPYAVHEAQLTADDLGELARVAARPRRRLGVAARHANARWIGLIRQPDGDAADPSRRPTRPRRHLFHLRPGIGPRRTGRARVLQTDVRERSLRR